jgi:hypothetical protein
MGGAWQSTVLIVYKDKKQIATQKRLAMTDSMQIAAQNKLAAEPGNKGKNPRRTE